ncbi:MAG: FAD-linked oxidase C-terminal domain-containing protein [Candidatus Marinimicrobia bacterium]|nr:FAD-linked oxidase C-terminal domain-containing protein [Candidatus Neomarinimicrobiota bacterium]MDP6593360.1 FAD-linked oxidase C-terminal domain-containing protein [Candidatus Neomarinimicrobiota bacterium]MDP6836963.1 FAD-linked oxidase C-terminal domain-containing protein [Candidatus Neomarinimicrobiota bacterium]MDP6966145.1 FAD-linked oxidase C-terminal domain-containing protein [Candidatus Neomarinimicrobiota bacterium]
MSQTEKLLAELSALLGSERITSDPTELLVYECDGLTLSKHPPDAVVYPQSTEEVAEIVRICHRHATPFLARGAGTGLSGGAIAAQGGVVIQMSRMNSILEIDYEDEIAIVQPGLVNLELSQETTSCGYHFAPDPASQKACTIGGNVAENAGGPHTLKYGVTVNHILGVKAVMPSGDIVQFGGRLEETVGYDLTGIMVGSEGTFCIVTEAIVRLTKNPETQRTFLAVFDSVEDASSTVSNIIAAGIIPAALELIDNLVIKAVESHLKAGFPTDAAAILLIEIDGNESVLEDEAYRIEAVCSASGAVDFQQAQSEEERQKLWRGRKEAIGAVGRITPAFYTNDGVVPRSKLPQILKFNLETGKKFGLRVAHLCHAGDGNIHPIILYDPDDHAQVDAAVKTSETILEECVRMGGALSGEHGIGTEKVQTFGIMFTKEDQAQMLKMRDVFNTTGLLNPGKIFPSGSGCGETRLRKTVSGGGWL